MYIDYDYERKKIRQNRGCVKSVECVVDYRSQGGVYVCMYVLLVG